MENWSKLSRLPKEKIQALQNKKLKRFIRHFVPYSPYYRELFAKNNLSFSDIQTTDDLTKLPFTTKEDLAPSDDDPGRPRLWNGSLSRFICILLPAVPPGPPLLAILLMI